MKLHLGCGERYLEGYINIDFPDKEHTVQTKTVADEYIDILSLRFLSESIEEVRLHHVFEHFTRPTACALLAGWYSWLKPGGLIRIEVPDFQKTARIITSRFTAYKKKLFAERHLYGTHEANWAVHKEGYTPIILKRKMEFFGFSPIKIRRNSYKGIYNFELFAIKKKLQNTKEYFKNITEQYLKNYLLDESNTEKRLLNVWMNIYKNQIEASWAENE